MGAVRVQCKDLHKELDWHRLCRRSPRQLDLHAFACARRRSDWWSGWDCRSQRRVCGSKRYGGLTPLLAERRKLEGRGGQPLTGCSSVPARRHVEIARHAFPGLIELRQVIFSSRIAMSSRARVPYGSLSRVARRACAAITQHSDIEFGENISGFGGATVPAVGGRRVLPNSFPKVVEQPEPESGARIALFGAWPPYAQGVDEATSSIGRLTRIAADALLRCVWRNRVSARRTDREQTQQGDQRCRRAERRTGPTQPGVNAK